MSVLLFQSYLKEKFDDPACTLGYPEMYIETEMTFVSGDRLIIACESIVM